MIAVMSLVRPVESGSSLGKEGKLGLNVNRSGVAECQ